MQILKELQRRNVFRVSIGYLISAWLISQIADFVLDLIGAPEWFLRAIVLVLALGFPVVAFFAWAYEVTPEGIKKESEVDRSQSITHVTGKKLDRAIMVVLAMALAYFIWESRIAPKAVSEAPEVAQVVEAVEEAPVEPSEAADPGQKSIAVLPFENRSNREEDQFFTDGIHDDLLTTIAKIGSMKVISRTSVMEYRGTTKKIPEIAAELGVAHVLEGGIQRAGNQVRINVQLIDARSDQHLWAEIFDRELTAENLFAIQSEISNKIAEALQATLTPEERERVNAMPTENLAAYEAYHRGKQLMATRRTEELEEAVREFERAVELDPGFALAWVSVADSHFLRGRYRGDPEIYSIPAREHAVQKALELDPNLGEAWVSKASIHEFLEEREEMEAAYRKGIELSPNYATAYHWYSISFSEDVLRSRERLDLAYKAAELDPHSNIIKMTLASELLRQGQFSRGVQLAQNLIDLDPQFPNSYSLLFSHYVYSTGEYARGLAYKWKEIEVDPGNIMHHTEVVNVLIEAGDMEGARAAQEKIIEMDPDHFAAGWIEWRMAIKTKNISRIKESRTWLLSHVEDYPWITDGPLAYSYFLTRDYDLALAAVVKEEPGWLNPDEWEMTIRRGVSMACYISWILLKTGEEELGSRLLETTIEFQENRLPAAVEHPDRYSPDVCYLARGDVEKALDSLEMQLAHGHIYSMKSQLSSEVYDPIRHEPRFNAILEEYERLIEVQRKLIEEMDAQAAI